MAPISTALGVTGMPGLTAYHGLLAVGRPRPGDTVLVSAASGAVGAVVGQIAKMNGCRVIGTVGSQQKADYCIQELGYDAVINYKTEDVFARLAEAAPDGVDIYFDNVGGETLEAALATMNTYGRIVACGAISRYNDAELRPGPNNMFLVIARRLKIQGFIISDHEAHRSAFEADMTRWLAEGKVRYRETVTEGVENAPKAFLQLFTGNKIGKQIVRVG